MRRIEAWRAVTCIVMIVVAALAAGLHGLAGWVALLGEIVLGAIAVRLALRHRALRLQDRPSEDSTHG